MTPGMDLDYLEDILNRKETFADDTFPEPSLPRTPMTSRTPIPPPPAPPSGNDNTLIAASLNSLAKAITAQSQMFARQFNRRTPEPDIPLFQDLPNFAPRDANGTNPNSPDSIDPRRSLWPHVTNSAINAIIEGTLPLDKLILLVPVEHRSVPADRGDLTLANGILQQATPTPDVGRLSKQFPTPASFLRAFATWAAIKQTYETPNAFLAAARLMHIDGMMHLSMTALWGKVLRYELAFFRTHQNSKDPKVWSTLDTTVFLTSGLNPPTEQSDQRLVNRMLPCFRYNRRPGRGEKPCNTSSCKYQHICNFDNERCNARHPAYDCPLNSQRNDHRDDRQFFNGRGNTGDRNPNRLPVNDRTRP